MIHWSGHVAQGEGSQQEKDQMGCARTDFKIPFHPRSSDCWSGQGLS